jgi:hypothetical protein
MKTLTLILALTFTVMFSSTSFARGTYFCEHKKTILIQDGGNEDFIFSRIDHKNFKFQKQEKEIKFSPIFNNSKFIIQENLFIPKGSSDFFTALAGDTSMQYLDGHLIVSSRMLPFGLMVVMAKCDKF